MKTRRRKRMATCTEYQAYWKLHDPDPNVKWCADKLAEEAHEVREAVLNDDHEAVLLELGDAAAFLTALAQAYGYTLEEVFGANIEKLDNRRRYGKHNHGVRS